MAEREIINRIVWRSDQASAQQVIEQNKAAATSFGLSAAALQELNTQAALFQARSAGFLDPAVVAAKDYRAALADLTTGLGQVQSAEAGVARQAQQAADALERQQKSSVIRPLGGFAGGVVPEPSDAALGISGGNAGLVSNLRGAQQAAIALPGVGYQSPLVVGIRGLGLVAEKTGASVGGLATGLGVAGLAATAFIVVMKAFQASVDATRERLTAGLRAQDAYYAAIAELTDQEAANRIEELGREIDAKRRQLAETEGAIADAQLTQTTLFGVDIGVELPTFKGALGDVLGLTDELFTKRGAQRTELQALIDEESRLQQGRNEGVFATNDAAAAEEELAKQREKYLKELTGQIDQEGQSRLQLAELRRTGTQEEYDSFIQRNTDEINLIRNYLIPQYELAGAATGELTDRLGDLTHANELAAQAALPYIQAREREAQLQEDLKEKSDAVNEGLQDLADIQAKLGEASAKASETLQALNDAITENQQRVGEIEADYGDKIADAREKLGDKLVDIDAKSAERIRQQKENDNLSIEAAIARGDIAAAQQILAQQRLREQQEKRNVEQQKEDAREAFEDQLKQAAEYRDKALKQEADRFAKEYRQREQAHNEALQQERALLAAEAAQRAANAFVVQYWNGVIAQAYAALGSASQSLANQVTAAAAQMRSGMTGGSRQTTPMTIEQFAAGYIPSELIRNDYRYLGSTPGAASPFPVSGGRAAFPIAFDTPSYNTRPGVYYSGVPEFHIPMADFNRLNVGSMGGVQATIYIDGAGMDTNELSQTLVDKMKQLDEQAKVDVVQRITMVNRSARRGR